MTPQSPAVLLSIAAIGAGLALLQHRRGRRMAAVAEARFQTVLAERARQARQLHDTLLQRFMGIILQIDGVRDSLQQQSNPLADDLSRILDQADRTLRESREMVWVADTDPTQAPGGHTSSPPGGTTAEG